MKLSGWIWLSVGILIAAISGYVYIAIPKDGQPNMAMAFFFFVGIIFILVGVFRLFFKKVEDDISIMDSIVQKDKTEQYIREHAAVDNARPNRVEQTVQQMSQQRLNTQQMNSQMHHAQTQHNNTYSQSHQYTGPVRTQQAPHATAGTNIGQTHTQIQHPQQHHVQNAEHSVKCRRCGNVNHAQSNYCHQCGNRLK
jgi:hypothetical protein